MGVLIYINKNNDIRKRRLKIAEEIRGAVPESIVEVIEAKSKNESIESITKADAVIIFAHGGEDAIYHDLSFGFDGNDEVLIDYNNIDVLKGKKVIAFCCYTARKLGGYAVQNGSCTSYVGFRDAINKELLFSSGRTPGEVIHFLNTINNNAFKKIIVEAINNKLTIKEIVKKLRHEISMSALKHIDSCEIDGCKFDKKYMPQVMLTVGNTSSGIMYYGDGNATLR